VFENVKIKISLKISLMQIYVTSNKSKLITAYTKDKTFVLKSQSP